MIDNNLQETVLEAELAICTALAGCAGVNKLSPEDRRKAAAMALCSMLVTQLMANGCPLDQLGEATKRLTLVVRSPFYDEVIPIVDSTSDDRTVNNVMRHAYHVLSDAEKAQMQAIKDGGLAFHDLIAGIGNSREIALAKTKVEEAVMWAVKHITA